MKFKCKFFCPKYSNESISFRNNTIDGAEYNSYQFYAQLNRKLY